MATVVDLCSREVIGYAAAPYMRASLAVEAICAAHHTGLVAGNAIMHTDRGGQYHSRAYKAALRRLDLRQSIGRTGSCLDGAAAESFFATIKAEIGTDAWPDRHPAHRSPAVAHSTSRSSLTRVISSRSTPTAAAPESPVRRRLIKRTAARRRVADSD